MKKINMIFNEDKLEKEIIRVWGEFGSHNEVFQNMKKKITHKQKLDNDVLIQNKNKLRKHKSIGIRENKRCN
jgi:hypothetical protein